MILNKYNLLLWVILLVACKTETGKTEVAPVINTSNTSIKKQDTTPKTPPSSEWINPEGKTLSTRFPVPKNYERMPVAENSFGTYLRSLPIKPDGTQVRYFDGRIKSNKKVYVGVVDMDIGKKDLQQCADAVMRLRAEYLFDQKQYEDIHFNFTNGFRVEYTKWMEGNRMVVKGNKTYWQKSAAPSNSYESFLKFMDLIFMYAGTLSLSKELKPIQVEDIQPGDVFIWGGSPGHAVIVADVAQDKTSGEKIFMLAQSYMPAQETQILDNTDEEGFGPWYSTDFGSELSTPEWRFQRDALKRF